MLLHTRLDILHLDVQVLCHIDFFPWSLKRSFTLDEASLKPLQMDSDSASFHVLFKHIMRSLLYTAFLEGEAGCCGFECIDID